MTFDPPHRVVGGVGVPLTAKYVWKVLLKYCRKTASDIRICSPVIYSLDPIYGCHLTKNIINGVTKYVNHTHL